jgi:hypothetical protein
MTGVDHEEMSRFLQDLNKSDLQVFLGTPNSSINKTEHHDITDILLKVALNTITLTLNKAQF